MSSDIPNDDDDFQLSSNISSSKTDDLSSDGDEIETCDAIACDSDGDANANGADHLGDVIDLDADSLPAYALAVALRRLSSAQANGDGKKRSAISHAPIDIPSANKKARA